MVVVQRAVVGRLGEVSQPAVWKERRPSRLCGLWGRAGIFVAALFVLGVLANLFVSASAAALLHIPELVVRKTVETILSVFANTTVGAILPPWARQ